MQTQIEKPKRDIPRTWGDTVWDIVGYAGFLSSMVLLFVVWGALPEEVPAHYNAAGDVDRWGAKFELWILPLVGILTFFPVQLIERRPEIHNYPKRLDASNAEQFYKNSRNLINRLKNIGLFTFAFITVESVSIAMKWNSGFGFWSLPVILTAFILPIVIHLLKRRKIK